MAIRRVRLRRHSNMLKHLLVHVAVFNLGLIMRKLIDRGIPRGQQGENGVVLLTLLRLRLGVSAPPSASKKCTDSFDRLELPGSFPEPSNNALLGAGKKPVSPKAARAKYDRAANVFSARRELFANSRTCPGKVVPCPMSWLCGGTPPAHHSSTQSGSWLSH